MKRKRRLKAETIRKLEGSIFIAPWVAGFLLFAAYPLIYTLYMSFHKVNMFVTGIETRYLGLYYYKQILFENGSALYEELFPFLRQVLIMLPIIVVFSLLVAMLLNQKFLGRTFFRSVFFLPVIFSAGPIVFELITQGQGTLGFLEKYDVAALIDSNLSGAWASPLKTVLESFVLILWYSGVEILIFLAGRQTLPQSAYEAARIDGASPWECFWKITLPAMVPFIFLNLIYCVVDLFTFPQNPILKKIETGVYDSYGYASAFSWIYFTIILLFLGLVSLVFYRINKGYAASR
jgi:ABC-type sugar transport system permease subunit